MSPPDPNTSTREEFTKHLTSLECPGNASAEYRKAYTSHQRLLDLLAHHPAMASNLQQTYMTPAASKNKVYFQWDFIGRSLFMLQSVDPAKPRGTAWTDVQGRSMMAQVLMTDSTGKLEAMNRQMGYKDDAGVEFGEQVLAAVAALT